MLNFRDHRKLMIIDGHTGFTGGINLADEYINAYEKLGHWKDSAFLIKGEPVWSLTMMFLAMWEYLREKRFLSMNSGLLNCPRLQKWRASFNPLEIIPGRRSSQRNGLS